MQLRQAPLRDIDRDHALFVAPEGWARLTRAVAEGLNLLVLGDRGRGKTSVLRQLQLTLRRDPGGDPVVFADLAAADTVDKALQTLVALASETLDRPLAWMPPVPRPNETEQERNERAALTALADLPACRFLLDNVDAERVGFPLFGVLRDRLWELPHRWVLAGDTRDRHKLLRPPADAFWEEVVELDLTTEQAAELAARRLDTRPVWLDELVAEVGTNPRRLLRAVLEAGREEGDAARVLDERRRWRERLAALDARSAALMAELADLAPVSPSDPELLERLGWARSSVHERLEELEADGLVRSWREPTGRGRPRRVFAPAGPGGPEHG